MFGRRSSRGLDRISSVVLAFVLAFKSNAAADTRADNATADARADDHSWESDSRASLLPNVSADTCSKSQPELCCAHDS